MMQAFVLTLTNLQSTPHLLSEPALPSIKASCSVNGNVPWISALPMQPPADSVVKIVKRRSSYHNASPASSMALYNAHRRLTLPEAEPTHVCFSANVSMLVPGYACSTIYRDRKPRLLVTDEPTSICVKEVQGARTILVYRCWLQCG